MNENTEEVLVPEVMPDNLPAAQETLHVDFEAVKAWVVANASKADGLEPTEETKTAAKKVRADLAKLTDKCKDAKKRVKNALLAPFAPYEEKIDQLIEIVEGKRIPLDEKIKAIDAALKEKQKNDLTAYLKTLVEAAFPDATFRTAPYWNGLIDANPTLTNLSTSLKKAKEILAKEVEARTGELEVIRATFASRGTELVAKAELEYAKTFNQVETLRSVNVYVAEQEAIAERQRKAAEAEAARKAAEAAAPSAAPEHAPTVAPEQTVAETAAPAPASAASDAEQPKPDLYEVTLKITGTLANLKALRDFMAAQGMTYEKVGSPVRVG